MSTIVVEETTLRDGEQTPDVNFMLEERVEIALALSELLTEDDALDAGFPAASAVDTRAIREIGRVCRHQAVVAVARMVVSDIDACREALAGCARPQIAIVVPSSELHRKIKLGVTEDALLEMAVGAVRYARRHLPCVSVAVEDATRTDIDVLVRLMDRVIDAGAEVVALADTIGTANPWTYGAMFAELRARVANIDRLSQLGAHCHDDLGLALANSLAALRAGANRVSCAFNGLGERAGNTATEELLMFFHTSDLIPNPNRARYRYDRIHHCSQLVQRTAGLSVQATKAVVGRNCFRHESGIHQDGLLKDLATYQLFAPEVVGRTGPEYVLGKHSGRHAFFKRLGELGVSLDRHDMDEVFADFKRLAETKKKLTDEDLLGLVQ